MSTEAIAKNGLGAGLAIILSIKLLALTAFTLNTLEILLCLIFKFFYDFFFFHVALTPLEDYSIPELSYELPELSDFYEWTKLMSLYYNYFYSVAYY